MQSFSRWLRHHGPPHTKVFGGGSATPHRPNIEPGCCRKLCLATKHGRLPKECPKRPPKAYRIFRGEIPGFGKRSWHSRETKPKLG